MIFIASLFLFIIAGVVGLVTQYRAPKCNRIFDLIGIH